MVEFGITSPTQRFDLCQTILKVCTDICMYNACRQVHVFQYRHMESHMITCTVHKEQQMVLSGYTHAWLKACTCAYAQQPAHIRAVHVHF